jgi:hypothetical protein
VCVLGAATSATALGFWAATLPRGWEAATRRFRGCP